MKNMKPLQYGFAMCLALAITASAVAQDAVKMYQQPYTLPTYEVGKPDPNPIFYTDRAYQGARGEVYPYPMLNELKEKKIDKKYKGLFLENEYIKICVLPELGGKMWYALDKTNGYHFVYNNEQVKPALIGMLGAWTSGGIEWNIPHHHRASTFMPIDYKLEEHPDGSKTIWIGEIERRHRMKWWVGYTLFPGKSYIKTSIRLYNRTPVEQSFLMFANTAVHANKNYQVIFPPVTQYGTYHSKTDFTEWPISHQHYSRVDYTSGVDVSRWKNHPQPVSIFDWGDGDFVAGYDHGNESGTLITGNPHIMVGRKFFEWGPGPVGSMWDHILTDSSGPYLELMAGIYSDNQPDYSWVNPSMVKKATMYFSPLRAIDGVKKVNTDAALNLDMVSSNNVLIGVNTTSVYKGAHIVMTAGEKRIYDHQQTIAPDQPFKTEISLPNGMTQYDLRLSLLTAGGDEVISYRPVEQKKEPMPDVVRPPKSPKEIETVEQLYREGLRLEQFYNPTLDPMEYYQEALRRDPHHSLVNTQVGIYYLKKGNYNEAGKYLRTAVNTVTQDYTAPKNAESLYYLGFTLLQLGEIDQAYKWLYKATWDLAWYAPAYFLIATIDAGRGDYQNALKDIDRSIETNTLNSNAYNLKAALLRRTGRSDEAEILAQKVLKDDPLNTWAANELYLVKKAAGAPSAGGILDNLNHQMSDDVESYLELATDYSNAGLYEDAITVLNRAANSDLKELNTYPMVYYYLGYYWQQMGNAEKAKVNFSKAGSMPSDYCFPYRFKSAEVLNASLKVIPNDAKAYYYLGNLYYDNMPEKAIDAWEQSVKIDDGLAIVHRNLAFAYDHIRNNYDEAIAQMERALELNSDDPRYYAELDNYYESSGVDPAKRLGLLEKNHKVVKNDDTALSREIRLLIFQGRYTDAIELLKGHHFRKIEGVGNIHNQWVDAYLLRGRKYMDNGDYQKALSDFEQALTYPENLEVGGGNREGQVYYFMGEAYEALGKAEQADKYYRMSTDSNYGWNEMKFRQALAYKKLGQKEKARQIFSGLIDRGQTLLSDDRRSDFFEKFSTDENESERKANAHYLIGLGKLGLGEQKDAKEQFEQTLKLNPAHLGAKVLL